MRLTSPILTGLRFAPLLLIAGSLACNTPPSSESDGETSGDGDGDPSGDGDGDGDGNPVIICTPGETQCADADTLEICAATGLTWEQEECGEHEECDPDWLDALGNTVATCVGPCDKLMDSPSSEGCSFYTTGLYQASLPDGTPIEDYPEDGIVIGNPQEVPVRVELRWVPYGSNQEELVEEVTIQPGQTYVFHLDPYITDYLNDVATSIFRSGMVYHVVSELPVIGYLHAPYVGQNTNGSTLLLPENVLKTDYVVYSHTAYVAPNYFAVIAVHDQTTVTWQPTVETAGDYLPLPFVLMGESGEQLLNRFDNIRINTSKALDRPPCEQDLSGTIISADKPIWVLSAVRGLRLPWCGQSPIMGCPSDPENVNPACNQGSDYAMEQNLPLDYWGREYVGAHSPLRGTENHHWRIYAGEDNITVNVSPSQPGTPINLAERGDWADLIVPAGTHLQFDSDGVFMPVQYVTAHYDNANSMGSPAMVQMVPTAQFLDRYAFVTAHIYDEHYVQVIRAGGGADVTLLPKQDPMDPQVVGNWEIVGEWEVATVLIPEGAYEIVSDDSFGIVQYGYSQHINTADNSAGYAYMGGMKAEVIYIP